MTDSRKFGCVAIGAGVLIVLAVITLIAAAVQVDYGHIRLVTRYGELTGRVLQPGLNWITPFVERTIDYTTQVQSYETSDNPDTSEADWTDYPINAQTSDGQQVTIKYTVLFHINPENVERVAQTIGKTSMIVENVVKAHSRNLARMLSQNYTAEDLFSGTGIVDYQEAVTNALNVEFLKVGISLDDFLVRKIEFDPDYIAAIERQQIAQENIETAQYEAAAAEYERDKAIKLAEAEAEKTRLLAQAEADNIKIIADADAYAIEAKGAALAANPLVLQWEFIKQLDGVTWGILPGDGLNYFLPIPSE